MSDRGRRLSKRSEAIKQRKISEDKPKKRQEKDRQRTLAKACQLKLSDTTED